MLFFIKKKTHSDLAIYLHACCFYPVKFTCRAAIKKGLFKTWPGLTTQLVDKHLPLSPATIKGHMIQEHSNLQSTKANLSKKLHIIDDLCNKTMKLTIGDIRQNNVTIDNTDLHPPPPAPNIKRNEVIHSD